MTTERFLLIAMVVVSICTALYIPKNQIRKALLALLAFQTTTWFVSLTLRQTGSVLFPVREFIKATQIVFITEFFFYPTIFVWFIFLFPTTRGFIYKALHWLIFISLSSFSAYFLAKYTDLAEFVSNNDIKNLFNTYWLFVIQYLICYIYIKWFYSDHSGK